MTERSKFQQKAIRNYYDNRESIAVQRISELVTELYLSEGKARQRHWKHLETHLKKLEVDQKTIDHLIEQDNPELVAKLLARLTAN